MSCECVKIKKYIIPKFFVDAEAVSNSEFVMSINVTLNIMIPKDVENQECIVEILLDYEKQNQESVLSAMFRGYVDTDLSLTEQQKTDLIKQEAVPVFYEEFRKFIGDTMEKTNINLPNIPSVDEVAL